MPPAQLKRIVEPSSPQTIDATSHHYPLVTGIQHELVSANDECDTIATTKEEEWVTKTTSEITTTRQIETRVKREILLEDGKILSDSGPSVITTAHEDTHTNNYQQTEHRELEPDEVQELEQLDGVTVAVQSGEAISADGRVLSVPVNTIVTTSLVSNPDGKVLESHNTRVLTHQETDNVKEVHESYHNGNVTNEAFLQAVNETEDDEDLRDILKELTNQTIVKSGPTLVKDITNVKRTVDTENTDELRALRPGGHIVTETKRTTTHEDFKDRALSDNEACSVASDQSLHQERSCHARRARTDHESKTDVMAGGRRIATHVHARTTAEDAEKEGDPNMDDPYDWDSLSMRMRRQRQLKQTTDDSYLKRPIDFEFEEETRKKETSKWLENHFGSESSRDSATEEVKTRTTIKHKIKTDDEGYYDKPIKLSPPPPVYANRPVRKTKVNVSEVVKRAPTKTNYFKGIGEWSQRDKRMPEPRNGSPARSPYGSDDRDSDKRIYIERTNGRTSPIHRNGRTSLARDDSAYVSSSTVHSPARGSPYRAGDSDRNERDNSAEEDYSRPRVIKHRIEDNRYDSGYRSSSRNETSEPPPDYSRRPSPEPSPPPLTTRRDERRMNQKTRFADDPERRRSPPRKSMSAAISNSIRKLVGKIRSASAERRSRWRNGSRSPSPGESRTYRQYDGDVAPPPTQAPSHRYYLGEDPFAGSIYGREHKYEGASPRRISRQRREQAENDQRNNYTTTLNRFSHSTSRLNPKISEEEERLRSAQTLPRKLTIEKRTSNQSTSSSNKTYHQLGPSKRSSSSVNINGHLNRTNDGHPVKPVRTYNKPLSRSKSFAIPETDIKPRYVSGMSRNYSTMYKSNPHLSKLDENHEQLKSPGIVSIINKSQRDLADAVSREAERKRERDGLFSARYGKSTSPYTNGLTNGKSHDESEKKHLFMKGLKERAPELYHTIHREDEVDGNGYTSRSPSYPRERYSEERKVVTKFAEPLCRDSSPFVSRFANDPSSKLRSTALRRGSNSSDNFSETYKYSTKSGDPDRPYITDTVEKVSKKVVPLKDGRGKEIIESREKNSITRNKMDSYSNFKYLDSGSRYTNYESKSPLYTEKRTSNYRLTEKIHDFRS